MGIPFIVVNNNGSSDRPAYNSALDRAIDRITDNSMSNFPKVHASYATAIAISGVVVLFLFAAFIFKRSVAGRFSLGIICLMNLFYCLHCVLTMYVFSFSLAICSTRNFFASFFEYAAIYLSTSIIVNLQITFLRDTTKPLASYLKYLLVIIPILVSALHQAPQHIYAAVKYGLCSSVIRSEPESAGYVLYGVFAVIFIPGVCIVYNAIASAWTVSLLVKRRRIINRTIGAFLASKGESQQVTIDTLKEIAWLQSVSKVYSSAIRIALFSLAPLIWLVLRCAELGLKNTIPRKVSDVSTLESGYYVGMATMPILVLASLILFLFDPVFGQLFSRASSSNTDQIERLAADIKSSGHAVTQSTTELLKTDSLHPISMEKGGLLSNVAEELKFDSAVCYVRTIEDINPFLRKL